METTRKFNSRARNCQFEYDTQISVRLLLLLYVLVKECRTSDIQMHTKDGSTHSQLMSSSHIPFIQMCVLSRSKKGAQTQHSIIRAHRRAHQESHLHRFCDSQPLQLILDNSYATNVKRSILVCDCCVVCMGSEDTCLASFKYR